VYKYYDPVDSLPGNAPIWNSSMVQIMRMPWELGDGKKAIFETQYRVVTRIHMVHLCGSNPPV
jgi:hypothetical protein